MAAPVHNDIGIVTKAMKQPLKPLVTWMLRLVPCPPRCVTGCSLLGCTCEQPLIRWSDLWRT